MQHLNTVLRRLEDNHFHWFICNLTRLEPLVWSKLYLKHLIYNISGLEIGEENL